MDSSGRIHMLEAGVSPVERELRQQFRHTGFVTKDPMPEQCDARKVLSALEKLVDAPPPVSASDAALLPLIPFERGYVLGVLAEYRAWRDRETAP
jgi:hypothetical protein